MKSTPISTRALIIAAAISTVSVPRLVRADQCWSEKTAADAQNDEAYYESKRDILAHQDSYSWHNPTGVAEALRNARQQYDQESSNISARYNECEAELQRERRAEQAAAFKEQLAQQRAAEQVQQQKLQEENAEANAKQKAFYEHLREQSANQQAKFNAQATQSDPDSRLKYIANSSKAIENAHQIGIPTESLNTYKKAADDTTNYLSGLPTRAVNGINGIGDTTTNMIGGKTTYNVPSATYTSAGTPAPQAPSFNNLTPSDPVTISPQLQALQTELQTEKQAEADRKMAADLLALVNGLNTPTITPPNAAQINRDFSSLLTGTQSASSRKTDTHNSDFSDLLHPVTGPAASPAVAPTPPSHPNDFSDLLH